MGHHRHGRELKRSTLWAAHLQQSHAMSAMSATETAERATAHHHAPKHHEQHCPTHNSMSLKSTIQEYEMCQLQNICGSTSNINESSCQKARYPCAHGPVSALLIYTQNLRLSGCMMCGHALLAYGRFLTLVTHRYSDCSRWAHALCQQVASRSK